MQAQLERVIYDTMAKIPSEPSVRVVPNEVPVEVTKIVKEEVAKLVETVRYVDRHVEVEVEKVITKEVPVEVPVPGKSHIVEKPVITEVFVDRVVQQEVPVPYDNVVIREVKFLNLICRRREANAWELWNCCEGRSQGTASYQILVLYYSNSTLLLTVRCPYAGADAIRSRASGREDRGKGSASVCRADRHEGGEK